MSGAGLNRTRVRANSSHGGVRQSAHRFGRSLVLAQAFLKDLSEPIRWLLRRAEGDQICRLKVIAERGERIDEVPQKHDSIIAWAWQRGSAGARDTIRGHDGGSEHAKIRRGPALGNACVT